MKNNLNKLLLTVVLFAGMVLTTLGQVTTSGISGRITGGNESLPGAAIVAVHVPSGTQYGTVTNADGRYSIQGMRVGGPYEVFVSFVGYGSQKSSNLFLTIGEDATLNFTLGEQAVEIGEVVAVGSRNQKFSSNRTGAQEIFTSETIEKLPTINRSLSDFTKLTPMSSGGNFGGTSYRYNNVTVDGASFNNSFGLGASLGASGTEPISLEAIDQIQVMIAPYDVRNGAFTGAGINSVTKGGTNSWTGSAYYYFKSPDLEGLRQKTIVLDKAKYTYNQKGFSVGGPIIKNKLFLFINGEMDRKESPIDWQPSPAKGQQGAGQSIVDVITLQTFSDYLENKFNYNPGSYSTSSVPTQADRLTTRLDWNINSKNSLSIKYFYLKSFNTNMPSTSGATGGSRNPSADRIPFSSSFYRSNNNFNIIMADLNSTINDKMSNTLKFGYSALRDFRDMDGGFFPQIDILNGTGWSYAAPGPKSADYVKGSLISTTVGTEENSYNNMLNSDIWQIQDNFTIEAGKHRFTLGTQSDYRKFLNGYARYFAGVWEFNSFDAFYKDVDTYRAWLAGPKTPGSFESLTSKYTKAYSLQPEFPYAKVDVLSLGFYGQDKWNVVPNLNLTLGLRMDLPVFLTDLLPNAALAAETFQGGVKIDVSKYPKTSILWSPRFGFNWDVYGNRDLQVRGGSGIFSGTPPYVWLSNQAGNNGLLFAQLSKPSGPLKDIGFDGDPNYGPAAGTAPKADIAFVDPNFKYPTLWKTNVAVDKKFGNGWIASIEILYNKDINNIYHSNVALPDDFSADAFVMPGADNRIIYTKTSTSAVAYTAVMMKNTSKGYSIYTTLQLQKDFTGSLKGLSVNGSYTFGQSKSVTDGSSSVARSAWQYRPAINPNSEELGYSAGSFPNRLLLSATYSKSFFNTTTSSFGLVYQRYSPFRFSYTYNGDLNGDGINLNDLVFVPATKDQITLVKNGSADPRTPDEIWAQLDNFIKQDPYLSTHRGVYSERNGAIAPFVNKVDMNFTQDFFVTTAKGQRNTLRISFDMVNLGNFINKNWGVEKTTVLGYQQYQFLNMVSKPNATTPATFTMPYVPAGTAGGGSTQTVLTQTFRDYQNISSRWQLQIGIKYIFK